MHILFPTDFYPESSIPWSFLYSIIKLVKWQSFLSHVWAGILLNRTCLHHPSLFLFKNISVHSWILFFSQCVRIHYHCYSFWCFNCPKCGWWEPAENGFQAFFFFTIFLLIFQYVFAFWHNKVFQAPFLFFPAPDLKSVISLRSPRLFQWGFVFRSQDLGLDVLIATW